MPIIEVPTDENNQELKFSEITLHLVQKTLETGVIPIPDLFRYVQVPTFANDPYSEIMELKMITKKKTLA